MDLTRKSRAAKRALLLASTAIIALLSACQGSDTGAASTAPAASSSSRTSGSDHGDGGY